MIIGIFFQDLVSLTSLKCQTRDPQLKVPPGGHLLRSVTSWKKSIDLSRILSRKPCISRQARYPKTTVADLFTCIWIYIAFNRINTNKKRVYRICYLNSGKITEKGSHVRNTRQFSVNFHSHTSVGSEQSQGSVHVLCSIIHVTIVRLREPNSPVL